MLNTLYLSILVLSLFSFSLGEKRDNVRVVVIGGGIAGHTAMYEMVLKGIGGPTKGKNTGLMLIEADAARTCGIIEPITYEESIIVEDPFSEDYKPYRTTTHAMRVNIATQPLMRCLANELRIPMYYTPWATDYRQDGYKALNGRFECAPDSPLANGLSSTCRAACREGYPNTLYVTDSPSCSTNFGSADLVIQTTSIPGNGAYNLWNYDPANNYNKGNFDPEDEWYGWAIGYENYYNPTANYSGDDTAYNGASTQPFNPNDPTQDHPRHQCRKFGDLYMMYQYYLGPDFAAFICNVNYGFLGDCRTGVDPCTYIGSSTERGWVAREWQTADEGYPVGSMTEFCTRQKWLTQHNPKNIKTTYVEGEKVLSVSKSGNKYTVKTPKRTVYADEVIFATQPEAISEMTGDIPAKLIEAPQFKVPLPMETITIIFHWKSESSGWNWMDAITDTVYSSYRMLNTGSCTNRIDILNDPYHNAGKMRSMRVTYTDNFCIKNLLSLARITDPNLDEYQGSTPFPLDTILVQEELREIRQLFTGEGPYAFFDIPEIPDPDQVNFDYEPFAWYYTKTGNPYTAKELLDWAVQPLKNERIALTHQAWNSLYSGWAIGSANNTREAMLSLFGSAYFTREEYDERRLCQDLQPIPWSDDWKVVYESPSDPSFQYSTPDLEPQLDYHNGMDNEHFPPYTKNQPIVWKL